MEGGGTPSLSRVRSGETQGSDKNQLDQESYREKIKEMDRKRTRGVFFP